MTERSTWQAQLMDLAAKATWFNPDDPRYPPEAAEQIHKAMGALLCYVHIVNHHQRKEVK